MSFINYDNNPDEGAPKNWEHSTFKEYYFQLYARKFKCFPRWGAKETKALTRLMSEYDADMLVAMLDMSVGDNQEFMLFYVTAPKYRQKYVDSTAGWEW